MRLNRYGFELPIPLLSRLLLQCPPTMDRVVRAASLVYRSGARARSRMDARAGVGLPPGGPGGRSG
ncbi:MAG: hypothetical protein PHD17_04210, partial [Methanothrix soehngenii]|uniref:hypothetical protein n=1 Tax=Methanothrix soehngenii TaxID=2223 RepID=UPI002A2B1C08|nr:hypothetical protein [Methanothrix soehngenii]